jgi:ATP-binding cassette subfamily B protein
MTSSRNSGAFICFGARRAFSIVGKTGSGKSTIARLLFRFYDPQTGQITFDGIPLKQLPLLETRQRVGMVTQSVELFNVSVRDNITFFDSSIPDKKLFETIKELGLSDWLERLPAGLDTNLGNDGAGLSAGEAQLLALARLFIQNP